MASSERSNLFVAKAGYAALLREELLDTRGADARLIGEDAIAVPEGKPLPPLQSTVFARQFLPLAVEVPIDPLCLDAAVEAVLHRVTVAAQRANRQTGRWTMHAFALEDNAANLLAGSLEKAVLGSIRAKLPRLAKRYLAPDAMLRESPKPTDFVVQLYVPSTAAVWLSIGSFATGVSPYVGGTLRMRAREGAPSRSARKIEEAFLAMGRYPQPGETAVDLGAAPGGWTFALARRGATVIAVDALDLALPPGRALTERVTHVRDNGLKYQPPAPVDWLCCDMIVAYHETLRVLSHWLERRWMRHFIVNLKLPKQAPWQAIKQALELLDRHGLAVARGRHLFHDRHEITLFGTRDEETTSTLL